MSPPGKAIRPPDRGGLPGAGPGGEEFYQKTRTLFSRSLNAEDEERMLSAARMLDPILCTVTLDPENPSTSHIADPNITRSPILSSDTLVSAFISSSLFRGRPDRRPHL